MCELDIGKTENERLIPTARYSFISAAGQGNPVACFLFQAMSGHMMMQLQLWLVIEGHSANAFTHICPLPSVPLPLCHLSSNPTDSSNMLCSAAITSRKNQVHKNGDVQANVTAM